MLPVSWAQNAAMPKAVTMRLMPPNMESAAGRTALNWEAPTARQLSAARRFTASIGTSPARVTEQKMLPRLMGSAPYAAAERWKYRWL